MDPCGGIQRKGQMGSHKKHVKVEIYNQKVTKRYKIRGNRQLKTEAISSSLIFTLPQTHTVYNSTLYFYKSEMTNLTSSRYIRIDGPSRFLHYGGKLRGVQHWVIGPRRYFLSKVLRHA
jgi:hypothetical protein